MTSNPHKLLHPKYRPDIDGLRAIAVLAVVGFHAFPGWVPGGFIGVDVFFVISGFLISTIIFSSLEKNSFSYLEFYIRRIKRIFPALLLVLLSSLVFGWYVLLSDEFSQLGKHVAGGAGFISNILLWSEDGYFDPAAETKPLLHLWSLGVEEQFYIFWPLLLGFVWTKKFNFLQITLAVAAISFAINIYWLNVDPVADFFLPLSRLWELMVGGILAFILLHRPHYLTINTNILSVFPMVGLAMIGASVFIFTEDTAFPGWWAALPTTGAALIIAGGTDSFTNKHILSNRIVVWIGLISYPLYLWHWPILSFLQIVYGELDRTTRITAVAVSLLLAWGTYVLIERPFKRGYSMASIVFLSSSMVALLILGLVVWKGGVSPRQNSEFSNRLVAAIEDWNWPGSLKPIEGNEILYLKKGSKEITLFYGDSHLQQYAPRIERMLENNPFYNTAIFATGLGCPPIPNVYEKKHPWCRSVRNAAIEYMNNPDVKTVVIGAAWNAYFIDQTSKSSGKTKYSFYYQNEKNEKYKFRGENGAQLAMDELESFIEKISRTKQVYIVLDSPKGEMFSPRYFFTGSRLTNIKEIETLTEDARTPYSPAQDKLHQAMQTMAKRLNINILDPVEYLCNQQGCMITNEKGEPIYRDEGHLRNLFVEQEADFMDRTIQ